VLTLAIGAAPGPVLHLLPLGATVHRLEVTCGDGIRRNVVLNHATEADYLASSDYLGGTIGRYANRIAGGRFVLDGRPIRVGTHDRGNHLHGGPDGFDRRTWTVASHGVDHAAFELVSPDGDQGFPGTVHAQVSYRCTPDAVTITLSAATDRPTVVNLTNHAYFNLAGAGTIDDHVLTVDADRYTPVDATGIPLGNHEPVSGTPFDFRAGQRLGDALRSSHEQIRAARGMDHNLVLNGGPGAPGAVLYAPQTGTVLSLFTDQPGLQVYTGNFLDGSSTGADGRLIRQGDGIALEPQLFPDSPNRPDYPSPRLQPGEAYSSLIRWMFGAVDR
jgi:galactose mutarotase-like enzyme